MQSRRLGRSLTEEELKRREIELPVIVCSSIRYNIPGILGRVFYNKSNDLKWAFKEILDKC